MYTFPSGLYSDIRIEDVFETKIELTDGRLDEIKEKEYKGAFIRVFDGNRWFYSATSDMEGIQGELDALAKLAEANESIENHPVVKKFEVNTGDFCEFTDEKDIASTKIEEKKKLIEGYTNLLKGDESIASLKSYYVDKRKKKSFYSSKGADLVFDFQMAGLRLSFNLKNGEKLFSESYDCASASFEDLKNREDEIKERFKQAVEFLNTAEDVNPGKYTVIFSPLAAGVFAHESFGHKSESDFMVGDEAMRKEWTLGKKVGADLLSIIDDGNPEGSGHVTFDDEGTRADKTYLIKDGTLMGRLHSASTAAYLEENVTGNGRAINFEYEPIVRMTTTYIDKGKKTLDELISEVEDGVLVETIKHGSGMSTFTIAPSLAYAIKDGKLAQPLKISVVSGNVFKTLNEIDGVSDTIQLHSFVLGGCGKMEQFPLSVGFGGPYVRVNHLDVQ
ncbi:MAG: TldD/PmbA family protein [Thermotogota bacterium]